MGNIVVRLSSLTLKNIKNVKNGIIIMPLPKRQNEKGIVKMDNLTFFPVHNIYIIHNSSILRKHLFVNEIHFI